MSLRSIFLLLFCPLLAQAAEEVEFLGARQLPALPELSGLAASREQPGHWWALNDSGNAPELITLNPALEQVGRVRIRGAVNHDWEDLAAFAQDGQNWLLIGDVGDNFALRAEGQLILIREPAPGDSVAEIERVIRYRYEDGSRDCESLAVDVANQQVLLADKRRRPVGLYALPLAAREGVVTAQRIAEFPELVPTPAPSVMGLGARRGRGTPTAMDLSADGLTLGVLTYLSLSQFQRLPGQSWSEALATPRLSLRLPRKSGFEAMAFDANGNVLIGAEGVPARFARWSSPKP